MKNAREAALSVLLRIESDKAYSALAVDAAVKENSLGPKDASLCTALVYGVLERRLTLDYIIRQYSDVPLRKLESLTLEILRLGVYQIVFMDRIPPFSAVNESVEIAKKHRLFKSAGYINGLLRSLVRNEGRYDLPKQTDSRYLSVKYSCPEPLIKLLSDSYGSDFTEKLLDSFFGRPELVARVNTLRTDARSLCETLQSNGVSAVPSPLTDNAVILSHTGAVEQLDAYKTGDFFIQDTASIICTLALSPKKGETVCDVCAAPGSKSFSIAMLMQNEGRVVSCDIHPHKLKLIDNSARRLGLRIVRSRLRDATLPATDSEKESFDRVLCDVPCSGIGAVRRKPEIKYKDTESFKSLPQLQYTILSNSAELLRTGGVLIYSTCTLNTAENDAVADRFLAEHNEFEPYILPLPKEIHNSIGENTDRVTLFPHIHGTDGFFIAGFKKR